jgi:hypothetical protein
MPDKPTTSLFDAIFKNKNGKIVLWQFPNIPLASWIFLSLLELLIKQSRAHSGVHALAEASLFVWAYLEIKMGVSLFRRILGGLVLLSLIISFFR